MSDLALSMLLSLVSAVAYAGGAIVQERVAADAPTTQYAPLHRPVWWAAVGLNGLGAVLHVAALAFGPLSLVQPSGALTIVFALPMAAWFVGRRAGATAWRGAVMATVGLAGLLSLTTASDGQSLSGPERLMVALVTAGSVIALMLSAHAAHRHPAVRSVLLAAAAGASFGIASVFTKTVALDWGDGTSLTLRLPSLLVIAALATTGMLLSQASYRGAGLAAPLSMVTVANPVVAAAVGLTMFGEGFRYGWTGTIAALTCGVVAAGGVVLLTAERLRSAPVPHAPDAPAAPPAPGAPDAPVRPGHPAPGAPRTPRPVSQPGPVVPASRIAPPAGPQTRTVPLVPKTAAELAGLTPQLADLPEVTVRTEATVLPTAPVGLPGGADRPAERDTTGSRPPGPPTSDDAACAAGTGPGPSDEAGPAEGVGPRAVADLAAQAGSGLPRVTDLPPVTEFPRVTDLRGTTEPPAPAASPGAARLAGLHRHYLGTGPGVADADLMCRARLRP